jgi:putative membrane protein insertion efficiency factor
LLIERVRTALRAGDRKAAAVASGLIAVYRALVSPLLGRNCRFEPSCSRYAAQALRRYGACAGARLAIARLARCHPWGGAGGFDPVP